MPVIVAMSSAPTVESPARERASSATWRCDSGSTSGCGGSGGRATREWRRAAPRRRGCEQSRHHAPVLGLELRPEPVRQAVVDQREIAMADRKVDLEQRHLERRACHPEERPRAPHLALALESPSRAPCRRRTARSRIRFCVQANTHGIARRSSKFCRRRGVTPAASRSSAPPARRRARPGGRTHEVLAVDEVAVDATSAGRRGRSRPGTRRARRRPCRRGRAGAPTPAAHDDPASSRSAYLPRSPRPAR